MLGNLEHVLEDIDKMGHKGPFPVCSESLLVGDDLGGVMEGQSGGGFVSRHGEEAAAC
jgi:hypothetical protein